MKQSAQNKIIFFWRKNNKIAEKKRIFSIWKFSKKFSLFSFEERGRAWETKGQHICPANASHLWLSASLRCGVSQLKSLGEKQEFQGSPPLDTLHPEENGDAVGGFAKQSAWPLLYTSVYSSKPWMKWGFDDKLLRLFYFPAISISLTRTEGAPLPPLVKYRSFAASVMFFSSS